MKKYSPKEAYSTDDEAVVIVKSKRGGWIAYIAAEAVDINNKRLIDHPVVANKVIDLKIEVLESKKS